MMESTEYRDRVLRMRSYEQFAQIGHYTSNPPVILNDDWVVNLISSQPLINPPPIPTLFIGYINTPPVPIEPVSDDSVITTASLSDSVKQRFDKTLLSVPDPQFIHRMTQLESDQLEWREVDDSGAIRKDRPGLEYMSRGSSVGREGDIWYNPSTDTKYILMRKMK